MSYWGPATRAELLSRDGSAVNVTAHPVLGRIPELRAATNQTSFDCLDTNGSARESAIDFSIAGNMCSSARCESTGQRCGDTSRCVSSVQSRARERFPVFDRWSGVLAAVCSRARWRASGRALRRRGAPLTFLCAQGHTWCVGGMERLQAKAHRHRGQCLSTTYLGVNGRYAFRCRAGHT